LYGSAGNGEITFHESSIAPPAPVPGKETTRERETERDRERQENVETEQSMHSRERKEGAKEPNGEEKRKRHEYVRCSDFDPCSSVTTYNIQP
jgi:hypothetical protein